MVDHAGCILAIVGSRDCHESAKVLINGLLGEHKPIAMVSGGARVRASDRMRQLVSVDEEAARMASQAGIQVIELKPTTWTWLGTGGIKERNMQIAESCVCLVRIGSTTSKTYGSGWTADYAEMIGKEVTRYILDEHGVWSVGNAKPPDVR